MPLLFKQCNCRTEMIFIYLFHIHPVLAILNSVLIWDHVSVPKPSYSINVHYINIKHYLRFTSLYCFANKEQC